MGLQLVRDGHVTAARLFDLLAANPARLLGLDAGGLAVGQDADLILIDEGAPWQVDAKKMAAWAGNTPRSEEHTSELQSLMRISYAVFCLKKKKIKRRTPNT